MKNIINATRYDVLVVGAGFAGVYLAYRLRELGLVVRILEAGAGVGGVWYWNRYPGARCDVESMEYSFSFSEELQQEWEWSERYAAQPEILRYINHVVDRFALRDLIQLNTKIVEAEFDKEANQWSLTTANEEVLRARYCIMATGCLSAANVPVLPGLHNFKGQWLHTSYWPEQDVDFSGKRVGVIGTGSTGIQLIPVVASKALHLTVFQRTAQYSIPLRNAKSDPRLQLALKRIYPSLRLQQRNCPTGVAGYPMPQQNATEVSAAERARAFEERWSFGGISFARAFKDIGISKEANRYATEFVATRMLQNVRDPEVRAMLTPKYPLGSKRLCADTNYFDTFNRDNVAVVDLTASPIMGVTPDGIRTSSAEVPLDVMIFATGFDAFTGSLLAVDLRVKNGTNLRDKWSGGPNTYLGMTTSGLPNLFIVTGPGSPSVLSNMVVSIEHDVDWIATCIQQAYRHGYNRIEATEAAEKAWGNHVDEVSTTALASTGESWWTGANVPGKLRRMIPYLGGVHAFQKRCAEVALSGYEGLRLLSVPETLPAIRKT